MPFSPFLKLFKGPLKGGGNFFRRLLELRGTWAELHLETHRVAAEPEVAWLIISAEMASLALSLIHI